MLHKNDCEILAHICTSLQAGRAASFGRKMLWKQKETAFWLFPFARPDAGTDEIFLIYIICYYMSYMPRSSAEGITVRTASASASISVLVYPVTEFAKRSPESVKH